MTLLELAERFDGLNAPDQGLTYRAESAGDFRYDEFTGERRFANPRPAELVTFGPRATFLFDVIYKHSADIAAALRTRSTQEGDDNVRT